MSNNQQQNNNQVPAVPDPAATLPVADPPATPPAQAPAQQHEPAVGSPRWKEVYGQKKSLERENQELISNQQRMLARMDALENKQKTTDFNSSTAKHKELMARAVEAGDTDAFNKIFESYNKKIQTDVMQPTPTTTPVVDNDIEIFKQYNPWYLTDPTRTAFASQVDQTLKLDPQWNDPNKVSQAQYLAEIARRTNMAFVGAPPPVNNGVPPVDQGAPGSYTPGYTPPADGGQDTPVVLSDVQKRVARNLLPNLSEAEAYKAYAKNL